MARRPKHKDQSKHALRRAQERYGLALSQNDLEAIRKMIQAGKTECAEKQSIRVSVHYVDYGGVTRMPIVYDRERKTIVSFLPRSYSPSDVEGYAL